MSQNNNNYLSEAQIKKQPEKKLNLKIADGAVSTNKIADGAVTAEKLSYNLVHEVTADLQNQIDSIQGATGLAVSNEFGNNSHIGVSQAALTEAINQLWECIDEFTGESHRGFEWNVFPATISGTGEHEITVTARCTGATRQFQTVAFYLNDSDIPFALAENVSTFTGYVTISTPSIIYIEAVILGFPYHDSYYISDAASAYTIYMGEGDSLSDVLNSECIKELDSNFRGNYNVEVENESGGNITIAIPSAIASNITRADMNGIEIVFNKSTVVNPGDGETYAVWVSAETFVKATGINAYNIDING